MWIFTRYGFYSAVCARQGDGRREQPVNPNRIMVRCRVRQHLEALIARFPDWLAGCEIKEFLGTDYAFRIFVDKPLWSQVLVGLNEEMDYDNFKGEVAGFQGRDRSGYVHALHDVWAVMHHLQKRSG